MPCNSEHLEANSQEEESRKACELLVYALTALGQASKDIPTWIKKGAKEYYGVPARLNELVRMLCATCQEMTKAQEDKIIYDGRNAKARKLAEWWDAHQKADRDRLREEAATRKRKKTKATALKKLTKAEREALQS